MKYMRLLYKVSVLIIIGIGYKAGFAQKNDLNNRIESIKNSELSEKDRMVLVKEYSNYYSNNAPLKGLMFIDKLYNEFEFSSIDKLYIQLYKVDNLLSLSHYKEAMTALDRIDTSITGANAFELRYEALCAKAKVQYLTSDYYEFYETVFKCKELYGRISNSVNKSCFNINYGKLLCFLDDTLEAVKVIKSDIVYNKGNNNIETEGLDYILLSSLCDNNSKVQIDSAYFYLEKALLLYKDFENKRGVGLSYFNIGSLDLKLNKLDSALHNFKISLHEFVDLNNLYYQAEIYLKFSEVYMRKGDLENSFNYMSEAEIIVKRLDILTLKYNLYRTRINYFNIVHDHVGVYNSKIELNIIQDSLETAKSLIDLRKLELENDWKKSKLEHIIEKNKMDKFYFIIVVLIMFLILVAVFFVVNKKRKVNSIELNRLRVLEDYNRKVVEKKSLNDDVERFGRELKEINFSINKYIENLPLSKKDLKVDLKKIARKFKLIINDDSIDEFTFQFAGLPEEFYLKLNVKYPNLTNNEKKLCAYIKLRMSTKEISEITGQTIRTIEVARYRLRKKLGLTNTDIDLSDFIAVI